MTDRKSRRSGYLPVVFVGLAFLTLIGAGLSTTDPAASVSRAQAASVSSTPGAATPSASAVPIGPTVSRWPVTAAGRPVTKGASLTPTPTPSPTGSSPATGEKPNIVFILTDDLSMNLLQYIPRVQAMQQNGTTFSQYYVTDSLCCPSRSSIFTGRYPHNTGVFTNHAPDGGYNLFHRTNGEASTFATDLEAAGYRTALMGKYLNEYYPKMAGKPGPVPPGWTEWAVGGSAYSEFNYKLNVNGKVRSYGDSAKDYMTDVLSKHGAAFIQRSVALKKPFMLELSTFAPHSPYIPAPRDHKKFPGLTAPRTPAFNSAGSNAPTWLASQKPLSKKAMKVLDQKFRKRVQSVQAVDAMVARIEAELVAQGVADNTYLIFSSDNGFHLGEHRLGAGKQTAFDTDVRVPLIVTGPGVPAGQTVDELAENIDLRPTFAALAGAVAPPTIDGHDLSGLMHGSLDPELRDAVLIEHHRSAADPHDPDVQPVTSGDPPTYAALRGPDWLYVEYITGEREYYNTTFDPDQLNNIESWLPAERLAQLHDTLSRMQDCAGVKSCWAAQQM